MTNAIFDTKIVAHLIPISTPDVSVDTKITVNGRGYSADVFCQCAYICYIGVCFPVCPQHSYSVLHQEMKVPFQLTWYLTPHSRTGAFAQAFAQETLSLKALSPVRLPVSNISGGATYFEDEPCSFGTALGFQTYVDPFDLVCLGLKRTPAHLRRLCIYTSLQSRILVCSQPQTWKGSSSILFAHQASPAKYVQVSHHTRP